MQGDHVALGGHVGGDGKEPVLDDRDGDHWCAICLATGGDEHTIDVDGEDQSGDAAWDEISRSPWVGERDAQGLAYTCDLQVSVARGNVCRL